MTTSSPARRRRAFAVLIAASVPLAACGGSGEDAAEGDQSTLRGAVVVSYGEESDARSVYINSGRDPEPVLAAPCDGSNIAKGFSDMSAGAEVTVTDAGGNTVALGRLEQGVRSGLSTCELAFSVDDVPPSEFYAVEVAGRGEQRYSRAELDDSGWDIELSLKTE